MFPAVHPGPAADGRPVAVPDRPIANHLSIFIGTSGWSYAHWTGVLYPDGLPPRERLGRYLPRLRTTELDSSYYRWPSDAAFLLQ